MDDQVTLKEYVDEIRSLIHSGRNDDAITLCQHILRYYPKHLDSYRLMAEASLEKGEFDNALELFRRVLSGDPENVVAYTALALIFQQQTLADEAVWNLERAYELAPTNLDIRERLLRLYAEVDRKPRTRLKLTPGALARLYVQEGLYYQAIQEFRGIASTSPKRFDARVGLIETLWNSGRMREAADTAQALLHTLPHCLKANILLGTIWAESGLKESETYLENARALDPTNQVAYNLLGRRSPLQPVEVMIPRYVPGAEPPPMRAPAEETTAEPSLETDWFTTELGTSEAANLGFTTEPSQDPGTSTEAVEMEPPIFSTEEIERFLAGPEEPVAPESAPISEAPVAETPVAETPTAESPFPDLNFQPPEEPSLPETEVTEPPVTEPGATVPILPEPAALEAEAPSEELKFAEPTPTREWAETSPILEAAEEQAPVREELVETLPIAETASETPPPTEEVTFVPPAEVVAAELPAAEQVPAEPVEPLVAPVPAEIQAEPSTAIELEAPSPTLEPFAAEETVPAVKPPSLESDLPPWLRGDLNAPVTEEMQTGDSSLPPWLTELQKTYSIDSGEKQADMSGLPTWVTDESKGEEQPVAPQSLSASTAEEKPDWLKEISASEESQMPSWAAGVLPTSPKDLAEPTTEALELPAWLTGAPVEPSSSAALIETQQTDLDQLQASLGPDMGEVMDLQSPQPVSDTTEELPGWLQTWQTQTTSPKVPGEPELVTTEEWQEEESRDQVPGMGIVETPPTQEKAGEEVVQATPEAPIAVELPEAEEAQPVEAVEIPPAVAREESPAPLQVPVQPTEAVAAAELPILAETSPVVPEVPKPAEPALEFAEIAQLVETEQTTPVAPETPTPEATAPVADVTEIAELVEPTPPAQAPEMPAIPPVPEKIVSITPASDVAESTPSIPVDMPGPEQMAGPARSIRRRKALKGSEYLERARSYCAANQLGDALKEYDLVIQYAPRLVNQAILDLEEIIRRPDSPLEAHRILGDAYTRADRLAEALERYRYVLDRVS